MKKIIGIRLKLILIITLTLVFIFIPFIFFNINQQRKDLIQNLKDNSKILLKVLSKSSSRHLVYFDDALLQELVFEYEKLDEVSFIDIFNIDGELAVEEDMSVPGGKIIKKKKRTNLKNFIVLNRDLIADFEDFPVGELGYKDLYMKKIGYIEAGFYLDKINTKIIRQTKISLGLFFLLVLTIIISLYFFISKFFIRPILKLSKASEHLDDESIEIETSSKDELGLLGKSFKEMRTNVNITKDGLKKEVDRQTKEIQHKNEKLQELDQKKTHFFQNISHELRTPLTLIMIPLEEAVRKFKNEESLQIAAKNSKRLYRLVNQLLDFQKIAAGKKDLELFPINLINFLNHCAQMFKVTATLKNISFSYTFNNQIISKEVLENNSLFILGDLDALEKIVFNYLSNALKHSKREGKIILDLSTSHDRVRISVSDDGHGISKENQKKLFQIFSQVDDSTTRNYEGTGLGLALVKDLAQEMKSHVGVESELKKGSTFYAEFDQFDFEISDILIIEDEQDICEIYETVIEKSKKIESYKIVNNAEEARKILAQCQFKCVITDAALPGEDGAGLLTYIYNHFPQTKRMLITGNAEDKMLEQAVNQGKVNHVIFKPWQEETLLKSIEEAIETSHLNQPESFHFKDWHLYDSEGPQEIPSEKEEIQIPSGSGEKILVVDDIKDMRNLIARTLKKQNYRTMTALNGNDGLVKAKLFEPDLIITDWMMPIMSGLEFIQKIKNDPKLKSIPTILLTAKSDEESKLLGTEKGSDAFLGKPFNEKELITLSRNLILLRQNISQFQEKTEEVKNLLDHIKFSIFAIGKDNKIISPVTKHSEKIFQKNILGQNIVDLLCFNAKECTDLSSAFNLIFGGDNLQFLALKDGLPQKVTLSDQKKGKGKNLKLSYYPLFNKNNLVEKLICFAEDLAESEKVYRDAKNDQINFQFIKEIISKENKEEISKNLEKTLHQVFHVLDDFISPLSATYGPTYFEKALKDCLIIARQNNRGLPLLEDQLDQFLVGLDVWNKQSSGKGNETQLEATSMICDIIETLLRYATNASLFFPINFHFVIPFTKTIFEKIKDIERIFKNLFDNVFLLRDVYNIDKENLRIIVQEAKSNPEFRKAIDLIQQRSILLSFLLKGLMEKECSKVYENLSCLVQQIPEGSRLNESIIKHNLIDPYKLILEETTNIENELLERIKAKRV